MRGFVRNTAHGPANSAQFGIAMLAEADPHRRAA